MSNLSDKCTCNCTIRWLDPAQASLYDREGKVVKCKCGKDSTTIVIQENGFINLCDECFSNS